MAGLGKNDVPNTATTMSIYPGAIGGQIQVKEISLKNG
jgi:hypothetical protein